MKFFLQLKLICLVVVAFLLNLPGLMTASELWHEWYRIKTQHIVYFEYPYMVSGLAWCLVALFGISPLLSSLLKRTRFVSASSLAIVVGLITMVVLPEYDPGVKMDLRATRLLSHADQSLAHWDDVHGRFPKDEFELSDALTVRPLSEAPIFCVDARGLSYTVRFVPNATKPYDGSLPDKPGVFVYAIRGDFHEYWLTMATLAEPVGGPVAFHRVPGMDRKLWVMNRTHRNDRKAQTGFVE